MGNAVKYSALAFVQIPCVEPIRRGCQAHHFNRGVAHFQIGNKPVVSRLSIFGQHVRLIDQDQVWRRDDVIGAFPDRLDACEGNGAV